MKNGALALLGLALLLLTGYLGMSRHAPLEPVTNESTTRQDSEAEAIEARKPDAPEARDSVARERAVPVEAKLAPPAKEPFGPPVRVVVRDKETKALVAGATVHVVPGSSAHLESAAAVEWSLLRADWERVAVRFGTAATTDANGVASLPAPPAAKPDEYRRGTNPWFVARKGDRYAQMAVSLPLQGTDEITLTLDRDLSARVRVIDAAGAAQVGVTLGLVFADRMEGASPFPFQQWTTEAPDGIATLCHLQTLQTQRTKASYAVRCLSPALLGSTLPLDLARPPTEVLTLTVQPSGALAFVLRGAPERGDQVRLRIVGDRNQFSASQRFESEPARAVFARVGLGATFSVGLERDSITVLRREIVGPRSVGEVVETVLDLDAECGHLLARIADPEGKPLANTAFRTEISTKRGRMLVQRLQSDAEARLRVPLATDFAKQPLTWIRFAVAEPKSTLTACPPTPVTWAAGDLDLGEVRCSAVPLLAAGRLVDEEGRGVQGGELGLTRLVPAARMKQMRSEWLEIVGPPQANVVTVREETGEFAIHGTMPKDGAMILVRHPRFVALPPVEFTVGQRDLVIVLSRGGDVRTRVRCPDAAIAKDLSLDLSGGEAGPASVFYASRTIASEDPSLASFGWSRVPEGTYELTVRSGASAERLFSLRGIVVPKSGVATDPRLAEIDLRSALLGYSLKVIDEHGAPLQGWGTASFTTTNDNHNTNISNGSAFFTSLARGIDAKVRFEGMRTQTVHCEPGETTITRLPSLVVAIQCEALANLVTRSGLEGVLMRVAETGNPNFGGDWGDSSSVGKDGTTRFKVSESGTYRFSVYGTSTSGNGEYTEIADFEPAKLEIKDSAAPQTFPVTLTAAGVTKFEAWLAKNRR